MIPGKFLHDELATNHVQKRSFEKVMSILITVAAVHYRHEKIFIQMTDYL